MWTAELKRIFGLEANAPAPTEILKLIHPEDRERVGTVIRASMDPNGDGVFQDEHRILRPNGGTRWVFAKGKMSFAGQGAARKARRGLGFVQDITERKAAEAALSQSEERYRTLVESATDIIITLDLEGRVTTVNPAIERILGYAPEELIGRPLSQFVSPEQMAMQQDMLRRKLEGEPATQYELEVPAKDGKRNLVLDVKSRLVRGQDGTPLAIHSIARDITERKEAEARQAVLVRELQHRTKNMLAVIQSIASSTLRRSKTLDAALDTLIGRLHALANAQEFVASGPGGGVPLRQLVDAELTPFAARAIVNGEPLVVGGAFAQSFALLLHELATNAVKHGALTAPNGRVVINWQIERSGPEAELHFSWAERGGPPAKAPAEAGLGTLLMGSMGKSPARIQGGGLRVRPQRAAVGSHPRQRRRRTVAYALTGEHTLRQKYSSLEQGESLRVPLATKCPGKSGRDDHEATTCTRSTARSALNSGRIPTADGRSPSSIGKSAGTSISTTYCSTICCSRPPRTPSTGLRNASIATPAKSEPGPSGRLSLLLRFRLQAPSGTNAKSAAFPLAKTCKE